MWHSHLPMVILHLNQANKTRVYLLRSLSRKLSMLFEKLRDCMPTLTRPLWNRWCFLTRQGYFSSVIPATTEKKHSIINLDDFRQPNPVIGTGDRKIADKIYAKCLAASAQFTITLRCDWTDACKINALLYLNEKSNEEICVSSRLFYSKDAVLL